MKKLSPKQRLLRALGLIKGDQNLPPEVVAAKAREREARRRHEHVEQVIRNYSDDLDMLITMYLQETVPAFLEWSVARKRLGSWEAAIKLLQAEIQGLLKALGQARNSATSGYDKKRRTLSATAQESFARVADVMNQVEHRAQAVNKAAAELKDVPIVEAPAVGKAVRALPGMEIGAMQAEFGRIAHELEDFGTRQLAGLVTPVVEAALEREAAAKAYMELYREQLREFSNHQMKPVDMARAIPGIMKRFHRG
ncbi:MAG TPA: hypothetical protein VHD61_09890 [Lacunisphaera sp.]|nr:hypothetical protein [Lacunisphaera sp.]